MKKTKEEIKHMFDDVELPADLTLEGNTPHTNNMFSSINNTSDGTAEYLKQILDIMRQLEKLQEQNTRIQNQQHNNQTRKRHIHRNNKHKHKTYSHRT